METLHIVISVLPDVFKPFNLFVMVMGVLGGIIVGALPGLTPTMGVVILVPFTFGMSPEAGLILLGGVYCGSVYAGAITAILFNIPGAPANIATLYDGYPMAQAGKAKQAIYYATTGSLVGGWVGMLALLFLAPPLAEISLKFGPAEIFWVAIFGVTIIASLSVGSMLKGLIGGAIGLFISTVGVDSVTGTERYIFGSQTLLGGIDIVAGLIGLFALSQVFIYFEQTLSQGKVKAVMVQSESGMLFKTVVDAFGRLRALSIGSIVGTIIGIIPGAGGQVAALTAYNETKRWSSFKKRETFGKGNPDGIISCEAANNAMAGGSLVPLFTLGIPGSPTAAVMLGGLMIHGLFPGHELFTVHAKVPYTFMVSMIFAQLVMFILGISVTAYLAKILSVPKYYLGPSIVTLCVIGAFATRNVIGDVYVMFAIGVIMYFAIKHGFSPAAVVLGHILGGIAENGFLLGARIGAATGSVPLYFLTRPICIIIICLVALSIGFAFFLELKEKRHLKQLDILNAAEVRKNVFTKSNWWPLKEMTGIQWNLIIAAALLLFAGIMLNYTRTFPYEPRLFPSILLIAIIIMSFLLIIDSIINPSKRANMKVLRDWPFFKMAFIIALVFIYVNIVRYTGFYSATFFFMLILPIYLNRERTFKFIAQNIVVAFLFTGILFYVFGQFLRVPTPSGYFF